MEEFQRLSEEKTRIEAEIEVIVEELTSGENAPGLKGPLVDQEGFPRADIDVYRVRHQRHLFATLQTDHQQIMKQIEQILPQVFEARNATTASNKQQVGSTSASAAVTATDTTKVTQVTSSLIENQSFGISEAEKQKKTFAYVESVQEDSPAEWAGLQENDQILVFGTADATNHRNLEAIKEIVAHNIGSVIRIVVRRKNRPDAKDKWLLCDLQLTPQQWKGRGMLGCVIMPFEEITSEEP